MSPEELASLLERKGIVEPSSASDRLVVSREFEDEVDSVRASIADRGAFDDLVTEHVEDEDVVGTLYDLGDREFAATLVATGRRLDGLSGDELARVALVLTEVAADDDPPAEVPEIFVPVGFERLQTALSLVPKAVVYVWLEDCPTCETVRDDFDELYSTPPPDVGWFAVYGPDSSERLYEEYDVVGGPTVLFFVGGEVDARLQGAHPRRTLEAEVQLLRDLDVAG